MSDPKGKKKTWEDWKEVEDVIDFITKTFPNDKDLQETLEKLKTPQDFKTELSCWEVRQRGRLDKLARLLRMVPLTKG